MCRATVIAGGDSHTCTYGALGAFGTGLGSTDIAACLALGEFWQAVPSTIRVEFTGEKQRFVAGKDLILAVIGEIGVGGATNAVLEFVGEGARALSVDERLAVSNMAVEAGAETGLFPPDDTSPTISSDRESRVQATVPGELASDPDAGFAQTLAIDLSALEPLVALPHLPGNVVPVAEAAGTQNRPGVHRQLLERDDDRPPPDGGGPARPHGPSRLPARSSFRRPSASTARRCARACSMCSSRPARWSRRPTCGACFGGAWACSPPASGR